MSSIRGLFLFLLLGSPLWALSLSLELNPAQPVAGESVEVKAILEGITGQLSIVNYPHSPQLQMNWQNISQQQSTTIVNGQMTRQFIISWSGQAGTQLGQYQLSPLQIVIGGQKLSSNAVPFSITQQQRSQFYLVQTEVTPADAVIGESITLHLDFCFAEQELNRYERQLGANYELAAKHYDAIGLPEKLEKDFHVHVAQAREAQNKSQWYGVDIGKRQIGGYLYRVHRISFLIEPKREGKLEIPALSQAFYKLTFQRDFFGRAVPAREGAPILASSEPIYVSVSSPPLTGRPLTFNGQVCRDLKVEVQIEDIQKGQTVQLHSPLSLKVIVTSNLPAASIQAPRWEQQNNILRNFDLNSSSIMRNDEGQRCVFSGIIARPKNKDVTELPALKIGWYNAATREYQESQSEAFPLKVEAIDDQTILESQAKEVLALQNNTPQIKASQHLHGLEVDSGLLLKKALPKWPWVWVFSAFGSATLLGSWFCSSSWRALRQQQKQSQERYGAKQTVQFIRHSKSPSEMMDILSRYLCSKYKVKDPYEALGPNAPLGALCKKTLEELEVAGFSNQSRDTSALQSKIVDLIQRCEGERS
jgi:hypothetical protein